jgi:hypothetical protein
VNVLATFAPHFERVLISQRTRQALALKRAQCGRTGRAATTRSGSSSLASRAPCRHRGTESSLLPCVRTPSPPHARASCDPLPVRRWLNGRSCPRAGRPRSGSDFDVQAIRAASVLTTSVGRYGASQMRPETHDAA